MRARGADDVEVFTPADVQKTTFSDDRMTIIETELAQRTESSEIKQLQEKVGGAGRNRTDA